MSKAWAEENGVDLMDCYFYTDSMSDVMLMEYVGFPVAVNPDPRLKVGPGRKCSNYETMELNSRIEGLLRVEEHFEHFLPGPTPMLPLTELLRLTSSRPSSSESSLLRSPGREV